MVGNVRAPMIGVSKGARFEGQAGADADIYGDDKSAYEKEVFDERTRGDFGTVSSGLGVVGSVFSMGSGIAALFQLRKKIKKEDDAKEKGKLKRQRAAQRGTTAASTVESGARITGVSSASAAADADADSPNELAEWLDASAGGVAGICVSLKSAIEMTMSGAKGFKDAFKILKRKWRQRKTGEHEKVGTIVLEMVTEFMKAGKAFVMTANAAIKGVSTILKKFEPAAEFVQTVPFLGAALNIIAQTIDFVVQGIGVATDVIKMARAKKYEHKLAEIKPQRRKHSHEKQRGRLADYLVDISVKRFKRALLSMFPKVATMIGDFISGLGSILNIIGSVTSGAMGGGVAVMAGGYVVSGVAAAVKIGAASIAPIASLIRHGKQGIRDTGSGASRKAKAAKWLGKKMHVNMDKTTANKDAELNRNVDRLLKEVRDLKDPATLSTRKEAQNEEANYRAVYVLIKATGLRPKDLLKADDFDAMQKMLRKAMKERDVAL